MLIRLCDFILITSIICLMRSATCSTLRDASRSAAPRPPRRPEIPDDALVIFSDLDEVPSAKARISAAEKGTGKCTESGKGCRSSVSWKLYTIEHSTKVQSS